MKDTGNPHTNKIPEPASVVQKVIDFLLLFIPNILAKRLVVIDILATDVPMPKVVELSGVCDRTVRRLLKSLQEGDTDGLFTLRNGSGSRSKTKGIEMETLEELANNNYHTQRQIADTIKDKFGISISLPVVARLLKNGQYRLCHERSRNRHQRHLYHRYGSLRNAPQDFGKICRQDRPSCAGKLTKTIYMIYSMMLDYGTHRNEATQENLALEDALFSLRLICNDCD